MIPFKNPFPVFFIALFLLVGGVSAMLMFSKGTNPFFPIDPDTKGVFVDPVANFTFEQTDPCASTPVKFTNTSTGTDLTYNWSFGDGQNSTLESPEHLFEEAEGNGTQAYVVTLTVTDSLGITNSKTETITFNQIPSTNVTSDRFDSDFDNLPFFYCMRQ